MVFPYLTSTDSMVNNKSFNTERIKSFDFFLEQEPWRLPSRQAEFNGTDRRRFGAHSDDQAVTGNQGYFEG